MNYPEALSKEFLLKCSLVMSYEQFIVSIVELIVLSWQHILSYDFHNMRVTWLFYHLFELEVHILQVYVPQDIRKIYFLHKISF